VDVLYDLFDLPTAFHKAGLAGLILLIESLKARQVLTADEAKYEVTSTQAIVTFTEPLVRKLMNDLYDAEVKEVAVKAKWQGAEESRPPTDIEKEAGTPFVYRVVQPKGATSTMCSTVRKKSGGSSGETCSGTFPVADQPPASHTTNGPRERPARKGRTLGQS
jgi:CRISPR-associated protein Cmx8